MNFEEFVKAYKETWADKAEQQQDSLPVIPWRKPKVVKRVVSSVPLGKKK
jgi:hypothetical protein